MTGRFEQAHRAMSQLFWLRLLAVFWNAPPFKSPWQSPAEEVAALIPGDLAVNTARVRQAVLEAVDHTGAKQGAVEQALYEHLSLGEPFETWLPTEHLATS